MNKTHLQQIKADVSSSIKKLSTRIQKIFEDAKLTEDLIEASRSKLLLDFHALQIDQSCRDLIRTIRQLKEYKIADGLNPAERLQFEEKCLGCVDNINNRIEQSYNELTTLSKEGLDVLQNASKLLR